MILAVFILGICSFLKDFIAFKLSLNHCGSLLYDVKIAIFSFFSWQGEEKYSFENPNPFIQNDEEIEVASVAYR